MSDIHRSNSAVIDDLVEAYNTGDARRFADFFAEDAVHGVLHSDQYLHGRDAIHARYVEVFAMHPQNRSDVVNRMAFGPFVLDRVRGDLRRDGADVPLQPKAFDLLWFLA